LKRGPTTPADAPADLEVAKRRLRREMAVRRRAVPHGVAEAAGREVAARLLGCPEFLAARRIAFYAALPDELPLRLAFDAALERGRCALFPAVEGESRLVFRPVERWEDLMPGRYGIPEPPERGTAVQPARGDLVLVPGVAFDAQGHRLGRGGGYYDAAFPPGVSAPPLLYGVGFEFQVVDSVPHGSRDRRMDAIVTERIIRQIPRITR
jgi:5-formyltetrahydrofolate cyclo-ligase